jgi:hypothetical protein
MNRSEYRIVEAGAGAHHVGMPGQYFDARSAKNAKLHDAVHQIEQELAGLPREDGTPQKLRVLWSSLVSLMALEPLHELRECPTCKQVGMRAATRCGNCWARLAPLASAPAKETAVVRGTD